MNWDYLFKVGIVIFCFIMIVIIPTIQVQDKLKNDMDDCYNYLQSKGYSADGDWFNRVGLLDLQFCNQLKEQETIQSKG